MFERETSPQTDARLEGFGPVGPWIQAGNGQLLNSVGERSREHNNVVKQKNT